MQFAAHRRANGGHDVVPGPDLEDVAQRPGCEAAAQHHVVGVHRREHDAGRRVTAQNGAGRGEARGCGPLRQVVSRRVAGRVLLVGDAAGYEDALTGEGISLAVKQAAAAVAAIVDEAPSSYELAWQRITRNYRLLTRGLVLASAPPLTRRAIVPACTLLPAAFQRGVNVLAT